MRGVRQSTSIVVLPMVIPVVMAVLLVGCGSPSDEVAAPPPTVSPTATPTASSAPMPTATPTGAPTPSVQDRRRATNRLWQAVDDDDVLGARRSITAGASLERRGDDGRTPLVEATKNRHVEMALLLLDAGADPDAKDDIDDSVFLYAGAEGFDTILAATIEHGADPSSINRFGGTALIPAAEHAHLDAMRMLIEAGVPLDHVNDLGWTALHEAIVLGSGGPRHQRAVAMLLDAGASPRVPDGDGRSPRELAAARGYDEIVAILDAHL